MRDGTVARFFIVSLNYAPEPTGFAPKATAYAEHLARRGHDVHVFTGFPFTPDWKRRDADRGRWARRERAGGATLHRLTHFIPRRPSSALQRVLMEGSLAVSALVAIVLTMIRHGRPDAVLYIGAQPALALLARVSARLAGCPYFVNITDLAAQAALDVGIAGPRLHALLERVEFAAYQGASTAFVLTPSFQRALVQRGFPARRIQLLRDPTDLDLIRPVSRDGTFRARYNISNAAFVVMHAGSMGLKQGLLNVVAAAGLTRDTDICWVLVGAGEALPQLIDAVRREQIDATVRFVPFQPDADLSRMFAAADVLLLNQVRAMKDTVIPSKLLTYMASGRPVLAAVNEHSQAAEILRDAGGGILVAPDDPGALARGAQTCRAADPSALAAFGARNRTYAEAHFDQRKIVTAHEARMLEDMGV